MSILPNDPFLQWHLRYPVRGVRGITLLDYIIFPLEVADAHHSCSQKNVKVKIIDFH